jgi:hypothetical protein
MSHVQAPDSRIVQRPIIKLGLVCGVALLMLGFTACQSPTTRAKDSGSKSGKALPAVDTAPTFNLELSIDQAYAAIPHRRTPMAFSGSDITGLEKDYLKLAFHLIDQAVVLRVVTYRQLQKEASESSQTLSKLDQVITFLESLEPPTRLQQYHKRLLEALSDQRAFFREWQSQGPQFVYRSPQLLATHSKVQHASGALKEAYDILMRSYPDENQENQMAFFDYHCALDFI